MTEAQPGRRWTVPVALIVVWLAGGSNFLAIKILTEVFPPLLVAALRLGCATLLLAPVALWRLRGTKPPSLRQLGSAAAGGILLLAFGQTALTVGLSYLPAGISAVLGSSAPIFLALFSWIVLGAPLRGRQIAGIALGIVGLTALTMGSGSSGELRAFGVIAVLLSAVAWAAGSLYTNRVDMPDDPVMSLLVQMAVSAAVVIFATWLTGQAGAFRPERLQPRHWVALAFSVLVGSIILFGLFTWLNRTVSSAVANTNAYVAPVVALALGAVFMREAVGPLEIIASVVTLAGAGLMLGRSETKPKPRDR